MNLARPIPKWRSERYSRKRCKERDRRYRRNHDHEESTCTKRLITWRSILSPLLSRLSRYRFSQQGYILNYHYLTFAISFGRSKSLNKVLRQRTKGSRHTMCLEPFCFLWYSLYAAALALIRSMTLLIPAHRDRSVKISTILPRSVKGGSWRTDKSLITPLWTMYSTIWLTK